MADELEISIVIPVFKNENTLIELNNRLINHLMLFRFEIVYVDDASPDGSLKTLKTLASKYKQVNPKIHSRQ